MDVEHQPSSNLARGWTSMSNIGGVCHRLDISRCQHRQCPADVEHDINRILTSGLTVQAYKQIAAVDFIC